MVCGGGRGGVGGRAVVMQSILDLVDNSGHFVKCL
jgi:hypothetical protein